MHSPWVRYGPLLPKPTALFTALFLPQPPGTMILQGNELVGGRGRGPLLFSTSGLSFWGGVEPSDGTVIDFTHPLHRQVLAGKVLAIPNGRGSSTGSQVLLELLLNGVAPAAIVLRKADLCMALGVIVAEEIFQRSIPVVCLGEEDYAALGTAGYAIVQGARVLAAGSETEAGSEMGSDTVDSTLGTPSTPDELLEKCGPQLTAREREMLAGEAGKAAQVAMRIVARTAAVQGAPRLLEVSQAHIDACTYIGPGGLRFAQALVEMGGKVIVPTTLNSSSTDRRRWRELGIPSALGEPAYALGDAYVAMGCNPTSFTCAPYLLDSRPGLGDQVAWGESNAVIYANSVLGARTQKYADYLDICAALTARAPLAGQHLPEERLATACLDASGLMEALGSEVCDSFYPVLGYLCGLKADVRVPVVTGLESSGATLDDLKAFSAAVGTSGSVAMFHVAGVTPEAPDAKTALGGQAPALSAKLTVGELAAVWRALDRGCVGPGGTGPRPPGDEKVDLVALGNPHLSLSECARLAELCAADGGTPCSENVSVVATIGRGVLEQARGAGYVDILEAFGMRFVNDTCWCMLTEPVVPADSRVLITNSAKYAHYAPGLVDRRVRFGSLAACVAAARTGLAPGPPKWVTEAPPAPHLVLAQPKEGGVGCGGSCPGGDERLQW